MAVIANYRRAFTTYLALIKYYWGRPGSPDAHDSNLDVVDSALQGHNTRLVALEAGGSATAFIPGQYVETTGPVTAVKGQVRGVNTTGGAITITLPAAPVVGDAPIMLVDHASTWGTNAVTVARNGNLIEGAASNITLNTTGLTVWLYWSGATFGWRVLCMPKDHNALRGLTTGNPHPQYAEIGNGENISGLWVFTKQVQNTDNANGDGSNFIVDTTTKSDSPATAGYAFGVARTGALKAGITMAGRVLADDGALSTPGFGFALDENTGLRRVGADQAALVAGGADIVKFNGTEVELPNNVKLRAAQAANDFITLHDTTAGGMLVAHETDINLLIDSNNNETTRKVSVRKNGTTIGGSTEVASIDEAGLVTAIGGVNASGGNIVAATGDITATAGKLAGKGDGITVSSLNVAASKTLALSDQGVMQRSTGASACNYTIPPNSSVAYPIGAFLPAFQDGTGEVAFVAGAGVTINRAEGLKISARYKSAGAYKIATDTWDLVGALKA